MRYIISLLMLLTASLLLAQGVISVEVPEMEPVEMTATATFQHNEIDESSAIVKSRQYEGVFWTLNDSGDKARVFPFTLDGNCVIPEWHTDYHGIEISDAVNIDWEDIATDDKGNLIIGACGNNGNTRKDLALYIVREPVPDGAISTRYQKKIPFRYPDQDRFPPKMRNFDCEAVFYADKHIYLLSKNRSDTNTSLYRLDTEDQLETNVLTKLATFDVKIGNVTAADCTPDGTKLAVLTYGNLWIFTGDTPGEWFKGSIQYMPVSAKQCEAICWDGDQLVMTNEQKDIMLVPMEKFVEVK